MIRSNRMKFRLLLTEILQRPPFTILQRFYGDEMTKDNLYKCKIYKDFVDLLVNL